MRSHRLITGLVVAGGTVSNVLGQATPPASTQPNTIASCNQWHVVAAGDSCYSIETANGITHAQFLAWNPDVSSDCSQNFWGQYAYCIGAPPAPAQPNTIATCNLWHVVTAGDSCYSIETSSGITHAEFLVWNPDVSNDCSQNFWGQYAYCVGAPPAPTQPNTVANCKRWHVVTAGDSCSTIETSNGISHAQFLAWNPSVSSDCSQNFWAQYAYCVGDGSAPSSTTTPPPSTSPSSSQGSHVSTVSPPGPTFTGSPTNCNRWHTIQSGDSCDLIETTYSITRQQFLEWNPAVSQDCSTNLWATYSYCVGIPSSWTSGSITTGPTTTMPPYSTRYPITSWNITQPSIDTAYPPTKTQAGQPSYCNEWHLVLPGETCEKIAWRYSAWMGMPDFHAWNPTLGVDCSGLYVYYYVCVGIQPQTSLTIDWPTNATQELPPYATWTDPPMPTDLYEPFVPSPTQGPLPGDCMAYYQARADENCRAILDEYDDITEAQFFAWHPFLNGNCNGLWAGNYYCVWAGASPPPVNTSSEGYVPPTTTRSIVTTLPTPVTNCVRVDTVKP